MGGGAGGYGDKGMTQPTLRKASVLRLEHEERQFSTMMPTVVTAIEKAHAEGKTECYMDDLTMAVQKELTSAGYKVDYMPGDRPSDPGSWRIAW